MVGNWRAVGNWRRSQANEIRKGAKHANHGKVYMPRVNLLAWSTWLACRQGTLAFYNNAHASSRAFDHSRCLTHTPRVQVSHLQFSDVFALGVGYFGNFILVRNAASLGDTSGLFEQS